MRIFDGCFSSWLQGQKNGFHFVLLSVRDYPLNGVAKLFVFFYKIVIPVKDHLCIFRIAEKAFEISSKTLQYINKCCNRRRCQIPFDLAYESLCQLRPVRQ